MQSHAQLYSLMLFSNINCSHDYAFHMSSQRVDYMWSHAQYPYIHLSSLRIDYILCFSIHAPHMPMHSYIICSHLGLIIFHAVGFKLK